ncbi:hypothetical protein KC19_12G142200 [Ceratodon purpureus]|uniref:Uncharacterized protein n=1 Tax=Ceratodon purpureus TaxID=3225 RepID=A0A8T0G7R5_CERPU|nr:hypothetical protein KC19_12G142200 [Ceratodon purpureus]
MGNVPVIAEVKTSFESLGDVVAGNPDRASQRWRAYSEQSVVGSGVRSAIAASQGNMQEAHRLGLQMGIATARATISAVGVGVVAAAVVAGGPAAGAVAGAVVGVVDTAAQGAISGQ